LGYLEHRFGGGLNTKASPDALPDGDLQFAWECAFDESGAVTSRSSRQVLFEDLDGEIRGEGDAVLGGTRYRFSKAGTTLYRNGTDLGEFAGTDHISTIVYNGYVYIADGTTFRRYSLASGLQSVGMEAPTTAPSQSSTATTGGFFKDGVYKWVFTTYNGVAESNFSPEYSKTFSGGTDTEMITLTVPVGATGTTERRIYRTDLNGVHFYRVGKIEDEAATTFEDLGGLPDEADENAEQGDEVTDEPRRVDTTTNGTPTTYPTPDLAQDDYSPDQRGNDIVITNLGILADWTDHDAPPETVRHLRFLTEAVYGIDGNSIRFTRTSQPEHWPIDYDIPIGKQTGETLMAIEPLGTDMIAYTDVGIWRFRRQGVDALQSTRERVDSPVGLASEWAVADVYVRGGQPAGHLFLARSGLYLFDGRSVSEIGFKVEKLFTDRSNIDSFNPDRLETAVMASSRDRVLLSYAHGNGANDRTMLIDLQDPQDIKFSIWGHDVANGYTTLHRDSDGKLIGGTDDGTLYELLVPGNESVTWLVKTKQFPFSGSTILDAPDAIVIDADLGGLSTTMIVESDLGPSPSYTLTGSGRRKHKRYLPMGFRANRVSVQLASNGEGRRKVYAIGIGTEDEAEARP
jgi:hypothetical protein